jgi:hypothetical protein
MYPPPIGTLLITGFNIIAFGFIGSALIVGGFCSSGCRISRVHGVITKSRRRTGLDCFLNRSNGC